MIHSKTQKTFKNWISQKKMESKKHNNNRNWLFRINTKPDKLIDLQVLQFDTFYEILFTLLGLNGHTKGGE